MSVDETLENNKEIIRRYGEEIWNQGDQDAIEELIHPDYVAHPPSFPESTNKEELKGIVAGFRNAFPDGEFTIENLVAEDNEVAVRWSFEGTHENEIMGVEPSNESVEFDVIGIYRIEDEQIIENWKHNVGTDFLTAIGISE